MVDTERLMRWFNIRQLTEIAAANPERRGALEEWLLDQVLCEQA